MKKLSILFMAVLIAAIAGCAGDDTTDPEGNLATVQNLELDAASAGQNVILVWSEVTDAEGYHVYFKADAEGEWNEIAEVTGTTATDIATVAGEYSVKAYAGDDYSENYATAVSTMPMVFTGTYTIYDQHAPASTYSGFIFYDPTSGDYGLTGSGLDENFHQDIAAYDDEPTGKGDDTISLYSGKEQYNGGATSYFQVPSGSAYGYADPSGTWNLSEVVYSGDNVFFVKMPWNSGADFAYGKLYNITKAAEPTSNNGTSVSFSFEYQPYTTGLSLFTSNAN